MTSRLAGLVATVMLLGVGLWLDQGCGASIGVTGGGDGGVAPPPPCTGGVDHDGDSYGEGCPAGKDCDDNAPAVFEGAPESCDGKDNDCNGQVDERGNSNACGTCEPGCDSYPGSGKPFPVDPGTDPNVKDPTGVVLDPNGDLTLDITRINFHYLWISNTYDLAGSTECSGAAPPNPARCRGSVSKIDSVSMKEVARYFSVTCASQNSPTGCADANGRPIVREHRHTPSRTAVDFNFDVWVANRSVHGGQPSATKIANDPSDCVDRNKNGKIDTSSDHSGDGKINPDCDADGLPDNATSTCLPDPQTGKVNPPEFLGDDDECILFTTNYGEDGDVGRSICLDSGKSTIAASNAWVGSFFRPELKRGVNRFYGINGTTGKIDYTVELPAGHHSYGCMADANHIVWSTDIGYSKRVGLGYDWPGSLAFFSTVGAQRVGPLLRGPNANNHWKDANGEYHHYGIAIDGEQRVWLGGIWSPWVLRYAPNRSSFDTLSQGVWTRIDVPSKFAPRGVAPDSRGKVWVGTNSKYILRLDQNLPDGQHDLTQTKDYYETKANGVCGVGVDFSGNVWGIGQSNDFASRLDVDSKGNVVQPATGTSKNLPVGKYPYTYSDFTGYGLMNFARSQGRYVYQIKACPAGVKATWTAVNWKATTPPGTSVVLRVRSGESSTSFGPWSAEFSSPPGYFGPKSTHPISPNPSTYLQVEFTLVNQNRTTPPTLHDYAVSYFCGNAPS